MPNILFKCELSMANSSSQSANSLQSGLTFIIGIICTAVAAIGIFWLSKIIPGIYQTLTQNGFSFMSNSVLFHLIWAIFFINLLIAGFKLINSALNKRTKDLVPGLTLYFLGASLVIIGLFYLVFEQYTYAIAAIVTGALCIYLEGLTEIA